MTETRHKTVLEVSVKANDVKKTAENVSDLFDPDRLSDFAQGIERITRAFEGMDRTLERLDRSIDALTKANLASLGAALGYDANGKWRGGGGGGGGPLRPGGAGDVGDRGGGGGGGDAGDTQRRRLQDERDKEAHKFYKRQNIERVSRAAGGMFQQGALSGIAGGIPFVGPLISGMLGGIQQFAETYIQHRVGIAGAFGQTGIADGMMGAGARHGLSPNEVPGALSEFAQRSGLRGKRLKTAFDTQLTLSRGLGIQSAGALVSATESSGGTVKDPAKLMMKAVASGFAVGFHEAHMDEYLQNIASWTDEVRSQGINLAPEATMAMVRGVGRWTGLEGKAAMHLAQGQTERMKQLMDDSPSLDQSIMYRAAFKIAQDRANEAARVESDRTGQKVEAKRVSIVDAMKLIEGQDPELMRERFKSLGQYGGGVNGALAIRRISGNTISLAVAERIASGTFTDQDLGVESTAEVEKKLKKEKKERDRAQAIARKEARMQARDIATGSKAAGAHYMVEDANRRVTETTIPIAAEAVKFGMDAAGKVGDVMKDPSVLMRGASELFSTAVTEFKSAVREMIDSVQKDLPWNRNSQTNRYDDTVEDLQEKVRGGESLTPEDIERLDEINRESGYGSRLPRMPKRKPKPKPAGVLPEGASSAVQNVPDGLRHAALIMQRVAEEYERDRSAAEGSFATGTG